MPFPRWSSSSAPDRFQSTPPQRAIELARSALATWRSPERRRAALKQLLDRVGFDTTDWIRVVMYEECFAFIRSLGPEQLDVLEISAGPQWRRQFHFRSFSETQYPDFDICAQKLDRQFDLIIADQVFEHLPWPYRAGRNVFAMLRPGGWFVIATPFLVRVHNVPIDCSRWTERGMSYLLQECGFAESEIRTASWGNRACVRSNFAKWRRYGWYRPLANEPDFPAVVWAFARRSAGGPGSG
jgi:SAM-dependent methyltransferase